nr:hypothetical protein [Paenibacillus sp. S02]
MKILSVHHKQCPLRRKQHEGSTRGLAAKLLFIDGKKYLKAQQYMEKGYRKDVPGI